MVDLSCDIYENTSLFQECRILKATHGLAITSIVFGSVALFVIILRDTILKAVYRAHKQIGFVIVLVLIFIPLLFTIMMPIWKIANNNSYLTYKFFPVFLELICFSGYAIAFCIEIYLGLNKTQGGLLSWFIYNHIYNRIYINYFFLFLNGFIVKSIL